MQAQLLEIPEEKIDLGNCAFCGETLGYDFEFVADEITNKKWIVCFFCAQGDRERKREFGIN